MPYYAPSVFYEVLAGKHPQMLRIAAEQLRHPIALVGTERHFSFSEYGPFSDQQFPQGEDVLLLNGEEHVLTVNTTRVRVQFSSNYQAVAVHCAVEGCIVVKV